MKHTGDITRHTVLWTANGQRHQSPVILEDGYTTEKDIPEMLAITHLQEASRAGEIEILEVKPAS